MLLFPLTISTDVVSNQRRALSPHADMQITQLWLFAYKSNPNGFLIGCYLNLVAPKGEEMLYTDIQTEKTRTSLHVTRI